MNPRPARRFPRLSGPIAGNREWTDAIHRFSPWLVMCGHDHMTPVRSRTWNHRVGNTLVVNVGQPHDGERRHALVKAEFAADEAGLPRAMRVRAMPCGESVDLPLR